MKNIILSILIILISTVLIYAKNIDVGSIDRSHVSDRSKGSFSSDVMERYTTLGSYWHTLVDVNKNVSLDFYIKNTIHQPTDSNGNDWINNNFSQIVLSDKSKESNKVLWSYFGLAAEISDGKLQNMAKKYNLTYVPIYDVIVNKKLDTVRVIFQTSTIIFVENINLNENIANRVAMANRIGIYNTYVIPTFPNNNGRLKDACFVTPDVIKITNTVGGEIYMKIFNETIKNTEWLNYNILWWNGVGNDIFDLSIYKKSLSYSEKSDKPIFEKYVWDDWCRMNHIKLDSYEKSPYFDEKSKGEFYDEYVWNNWVRMNEERFEEDK